MRQRRAAHTEDQSPRMEAVRLNVNEIYGGMMPGRGGDAGMPMLAASIAKRGLLQPVIVAKIEMASRYQLLCGARRLEACRMLGWSYIDAVVYGGRQPASCILEEEHTRLRPGFLQEAALISKHKAACRDTVLPSGEIEGRLALFQLDERTKEEIVRGHLTLEQAQPLLQIEDPEARREAASIIASRGLTPLQAQRLILSAPTKREGKRRLTHEFLEAVNALCAQFRRRGVCITLRICCHEGGLCVQIFLHHQENINAGQEMKDDNRIINKQSEYL